MRRSTIAFLLLGAALTAHAGSSIEIRDAWIRHMAGDRPMAGYFALDNKSEEDRRLVGASSDAFGAVHIHETVEKEGTMRMQPVRAVTVPAGGRVEFRPRGHHLMLMQRRQELEVGDKVSITLEFDDGERRSAVFTVKPAWQE